MTGLEERLRLPLDPGRMMMTGNMSEMERSKRMDRSNKLDAYHYQ